MVNIDYSNYYWQNDLVKLRAWKEDDKDWEYQHRQDHESLALYNKKITYPQSRKGIDEFTEKYKDFQDSKNLLFAIETIDGKLVGRVLMSEIREREGSFELKPFLASEYNDYAYAYAAMKLLLDYGFMERRLHKFQARVASIDERAIEMYKKLGCHIEITLRENLFIHGRYCDEYIMGLLDQEYRELLK